MRPLGPALALCLLVVLPLASALAGVSVSATARDGALDVRLDAGTSDADVHLVITHEDPLVGTVVDGVVRVNASAGANASVLLDELRADVNFTVRVLDASITLPKLPGVDDLLDVGKLLGLETLAETVVEKLPTADPDAPPRAAEPFLYAAGFRSPTWDGPRLLVTRESFVVVTWAHDPPGAGRDTVHAEVSRDGGHTFDAVDLDAALGDKAFCWCSMAELADGTVQIIAADGEGDPQAWRIDPRKAALTGPITLDAGAHAVNAQTRFVVHEEGDLFATANASVVSLVVLADNAPARVLGAATSSSEIDTRSLRAVASGAHAGAVWLTSEGSLSWMRAGDATSAAPLRVPGEERGIARATMDEAGTIHVTLERLRGVHPARGIELDSYYVRVPLGDKATSARIDADAEASMPAVVARAGRVWLVWMRGDGYFTMRAAESTDGGRSFEAPYDLEPRSSDTSIMRNPEAVGVFPDGRPAVALEGGTEVGTSTPVSAVLVAPFFEPSPRADLARLPTKVPIVVRHQEPWPQLGYDADVPGAGLWPGGQQNLPTTPIELEVQPVQTEGERPGTMNVPAPPASLAVGAGAAVALAIFRRRN